MRRLLFAIFLLPSVACSEREQACYEVNPDPESVRPPFPKVCGKDGYRPDTPDGLEGRGPYNISVCEPPDSSGSCQTCPEDEITDRVRAQLLEWMSEAHSPCRPPVIDKIEPACVTVPNEELGFEQCCYAVWYWGACNLKG